VCDKIAEHFQDKDGCYKKYVMDIVPFCNGEFYDGAFEILQIAIFFIGMLMFCMSLTDKEKHKDTYKVRSTIVKFGILITIITVIVDVIKLIATLIVEENMVKAVWELAMFTGMSILSLSCFVISWDYPCIPATLCMPILQMISEIAKNFVVDDSSCLYPY